MKLSLVIVSDPGSKHRHHLFRQVMRDEAFGDLRAGEGLLEERVVGVVG